MGGTTDSTIKLETVQEVLNMTEKQYNDALTAAGKWAFVCLYELVKTWDGADKKNLVRQAYALNLDSQEGGTRTRVNAILRIIEGREDRRALEEIRNTPRVCNEHPEVPAKIDELIARYF